jgi:hypothetical protein
MKLKSMEDFNREGDHSICRRQIVPWETAERCASGTKRKTKRERGKEIFVFHYVGSGKASI